MALLALLVAYILSLPASIHAQQFSTGGEKGSKCTAKTVGIQNYEEWCKSEEGKKDLCLNEIAEREEKAYLSDTVVSGGKFFVRTKCLTYDECDCELDPCKFWKYVGTTKWALVLFYAPWCSLSEQFINGPYQIFRKHFFGFEGPVLVSKMDADKHHLFATENYQVTGYPTLRLFPPNCYSSQYGCLLNSTFTHEIPNRNGSTTDEEVANILLSWVNYEKRKWEEDQNELVAKLTKLPKFAPRFPDVEKKQYKHQELPDTCKDAANIKQPCDLNYDNFYKVVGRKKWVLVLFYVEWCPFSQSFAPVYEALRAWYSPKGFERRANIVISRVDGDANVGLSKDFEVTEFPSLRLFPHSCYWRGGCSNNITYTFNKTRVDENGNEMDDQQYIRSITTWINGILGEDPIWPHYVPTPKPIPPPKPIPTPPPPPVVPVKKLPKKKVGVCENEPDTCLDDAVCEVGMCNFFKHVGRKHWTLVQVYSDWCGFDLWKPLVQELRAALDPDNWIVATMNSNNFGSFGEDYNIQDVPSMLLFPAGCYDFWEGCHKKYVTFVDQRYKYHHKNGTVILSKTVDDIVKFANITATNFTAWKDNLPNEWSFPLNWNAHFQNTIPMPEDGKIPEIPNNKMPPGKSYHKELPVENLNVLQETTSFLMQDGLSTVLPSPARHGVCHITDRSIRQCDACAGSSDSMEALQDKLKLAAVKEANTGTQ